MTIHPIEEGRVMPRPGRFPSPNPLLPGAPALYFQTDLAPGRLGHAAELMQNEQVGVVITLTQQSYQSGLGSILADCRRAGADLDGILLDANCYSGKGRRVDTRLNPHWVTAQRRAGLRAQLTDSPYLPAGDRDALTAILGQASRLGDGTVCVLALPLDWVTRDVEFLAEVINREGVPVALALEHAKDPLGVAKAVTGLAHLLDTSRVKIGMLRSDLSVIGAVAFGASWGAVGATSALRHIYPIKEGGGGRPATISALVPSCMAYRSLEMIAAGIAASPDNEIPWRCSCRFCTGLTIEPIASSAAAYRHSLAAIALLGERVLMGPSVLARKHTWLQTCNHAQTVNLDISATTGMNWEPPAFQGAWWKLYNKLPPLIPAPV
ncbi:MAG: hypothetical protein QM711_16850 [Micropruina sp.]|uniref:hypothetical protein n=1 Tax=Micropruina sp. TaxID=2737536 RepID=UPI0039E33090